MWTLATIGFILDYVSASFWIAQQCTDANANGYHNYKNQVYNQVRHSGR